MADDAPPQDYASLSHMEIVVRASLVLHSAAKNMVLGTPDTDVSKPKFPSEWLVTKDKGSVLIALPPPPTHPLPHPRVSPAR